MTSPARATVRAAVVGAIFTATLAVGLVTMLASFAAIGQERSDAEAQRWADSSRVHGRQVDSLKRGWDATNVLLAARREQLAPRVAHVQQMGQVIAVDTSHAVAELTPIEALNLAARAPLDTVRMANVARRGVDPMPYLVPRFLVDAWQEAAHVALKLDTASADYWRQLREASTIMAVQRLQRRDDSTHIAVLERKRSRCGRKCGVVLGVLGTGTAIWVTKRALDVVAKPSDGHGLHVAASHPLF